MLAGERIDPAHRHYATGMAFEIAGELDAARFEAAFARIVADFDALRLTLDERAGRPSLILHDAVDVSPGRVDFATERAPRHALRRWLRDWFPPRLAVAKRLFDAHLIRVEPGLHVFAFAAHHVISDGGCYPALIERLAARYRGEEPAPAPSWVDAMSRRAATTNESAATTSSPAAFPFRSSVVDRYRAGTVRFERRFGRERSARLVALARVVAGTGSDSRSVSESCLAICAAYLGRRFEVERFPVGVPLHRRRTPEERATFGLFMEPAVVEVVSSPDATIPSLVRSIAAALSRIRADTAPQPARAFDVGFNAHTYRFTDFCGLPMRVRWQHRGSDPIPLQFHLRGFGRGGFSLAVDVQRAEFDASEALDTIQRVFTMVDRIAEDPELPIAELDIVPPRERARILVRSRGRPFETAASRVDEILDRGAGTGSIVHGDRVVSGREFQASAAAIARRLNDSRIGPGSIVAISGQRSIDQLAAIAAVVSSGAAFLPIDPRWPDRRVAGILADAGVAANLDGARLDLVERERRALADRITGSADDPLYVLYTSGSTGEPKGVIGTHRGLTRRLEAFDRLAPPAADDVHLLRTPIGFVDAIAEIFAPLRSGARAVLLDDAALQDPDRTLAAIRVHRVTRLVLTPSLLRALLGRAADRDLESLRVVASSGEELPGALAREFTARAPRCALLNVYGSTEVAADVAVFRVGGEIEARVPLGAPIDGCEILLCDRRSRLVPFGAPGELVVAGECLALGYHRREREERDRFVVHPFDPSRRAFRTGDFARMRGDGALEFLGRRDRQVKVRGVRVEPEEIEAAIARFPGVLEAAVETRGDDRIELVAFVVPADPAAFDAGALRGFLAERLPSQAVPRHVVVRASLPRVSHGKLDRVALRAGSIDTPPAKAADGATENERKVLAAFADVLRAPGIGPDDDFFEHGGDSLLAVDAVIALETVFGRSLPIAELLKRPTARALARHLDAARDSGGSRGSGRVVRLGGGDRGVPLVCVPPAGADPTCFLALAKRLETAPRGPIVGLVPAGIEPGEDPDTRVETIAERYLDALRDELPERRVSLLGRCFGGLVALEMARRCAERGITVERLVLLDTRKPPGFAGPRDRGDRGDVEPADLADEDGDAARRRRATKAAHLEARASYRGGPVAAPAVLLYCGDSPEPRGAQRAWPRFLIGERTVRRLSGDHKFLLREPRVRALAKILAEVLP